MSPSPARDGVARARRGLAAGLRRAAIIDRLPVAWSASARVARARALVAADPDRALGTLLPLAISGHVDPAGISLLLRAAQAASTDVAAAALKTILAVPGEPAPAAVQAAVSLLARGGDPLLADQVSALFARVDTSRSGVELAQVAAALTQFRIQQSRSDVARWHQVRDEAVSTSAGAAALVATHLEEDAWADLVWALEEARSRGTDADLDARALAKAALRAAARGQLTAALTVAQAAQRAGDTTSSLNRLVVECRDQLDTLREGWHLEPPGQLDHAPVPGRILAVLGQSLPLRNGGYATRSHGILTSLAARGWAMAAVTKYGFPFDFWPESAAGRWPSEVDVVDGIPYHRNVTEGVTSYPRYPLREHVAAAAPGVVRVAQEHGAELIHASSLFDVGLSAARAADQLDLPFIYEMRGLKQLLEGARFPGFESSERGRYFETVELAVARRADRLFVITAALGAVMADLGVDPGVISVVPNGVHTDQFRPRGRDRALEAETGLSGKTVIGYVGGFVHYEGLELLLQAVDLLRRDRPNVHLLLVGDGAHARAVEAEARRLGLGPDILTMPGRVPHAEVDRWLSLIDITPFPRVPMPVCELISPIKPFEAMAMSKAVVVSDVAALTEIVADEVTGRHFAKGSSSSLAEVLRDLVDDPDQRTRLGTAAADWVRAERDWSSVTAAVDVAYRSVLERRSTSA